MVLIIFGIAVIAQVFLTIHSLKTTNKRLTWIISILAFLSFLIMFITFLNRDFKWMPFITLILIFAVIGFVKLIRKKFNINRSHARTITGGIIVIILIAISLFPAFIIKDTYIIPPTGEYKISNALYILTDEDRLETYSKDVQNRRLIAEFWYPEAQNESFPLIIFSHGGMGIRHSNLSLYNELASHGYVVCAVDHIYHSLFTEIDNKRISIDNTYMLEILSDDPSTDKQKSYENYEKWMEIRIDDVNFIIDYILGKNSISDDIYNIIDRDKIGVMGHSLGGSTALGIGRIRSDVSAIIALESPFMYDIIGVENNQFVYNEEIYPLPLLNVYTDDTWDRLSSLPQYWLNHYYITNEESHIENVYIEGAGHFSLTDLALTSPFITKMLNATKTTVDAKDCLKTINILCLDFFNRNLKNN